MQVTIMGYICGQQKNQNIFDYFMAFFDQMIPSLTVEKVKSARKPLFKV